MITNLVLLINSIDLQVTKDLLDNQVWLHLNKPKQKSRSQSFLHNYDLWPFTWSLRYPVASI